MCILHFDNERQNVANYVAMRVPDQCKQSSPCNCVSILYDVNQNMTVIRIRFRIRSIAWNMFAQNSFRFIQVWMALVVSWYRIVLLKHIVMHIQYDYPFRSFSCTFLVFWVLLLISFQVLLYWSFIAIINGHHNMYCKRILNIFFSKHRFYDAQCSFYEFFLLFLSFSFARCTPEKSRIWVRKTLLNEK